MEKNGTPASPATARASKVLPVPGGPTSSTPRGILPPSFWNFPGVFKNSTTSTRSFLASSTPATSANVVLGLSSSTTFARLLPKLKMFCCPCDARRYFNKKKTAYEIHGKKLINMLNRRLLSGGG